MPVVSLFDSGTNNTKKELTIVFNKDDVVDNYTFTTFKDSTVIGIGQ